MGIGEGIKVALFVMGLVFALLSSIYGLIKLASVVIRRYFSPAAKG
ncbi:MAG: OadG family protein [Candidatus Limiplasma sp.]|nr:OadG family protein [Candidatus Limiplasma sp.]